jgi:hypothetical protein
MALAEQPTADFLGGGLFLFGDLNGPPRRLVSQNSYLLRAQEGTVELGKMALLTLALSRRI